MKIYESKSKYIVFTRPKDKYATRLTLKDKPLNRVEDILHLGVWLTEDFLWDK